MVNENIHYPGQNKPLVVPLMSRTLITYLLFILNASKKKILCVTVYGTVQIFLKNTGKQLF